MICTVLGSCVAVCLWDCRKRFGGANHYIYGWAGNNSRTARYGDASIQCLIKLMIKAGSARKNLKAHIVGGGQNPDFSSAVGVENVTAAEKILRRYDIEVVTRDTGGNTGRKLIFDNECGEVVVYKGMSVRRDDWYR